MSLTVSAMLISVIFPSPLRILKDLSSLSCRFSNIRTFLVYKYSNFCVYKKEETFPALFHVNPKKHLGKFLRFKGSVPIKGFTFGKTLEIWKNY